MLLLAHTISLSHEQDQWVSRFTGLRQFGAAFSATGRFGDGGRKCIMRKKCVFLKYFEG